MTATSSMSRLWLAVLCLLVAAAPCGAVEVKVIDRKPVAGGAEVVLELVKDEGPTTYYQYSYRSKAGIDWVFYRKLVRFMRPDESEKRDYSWTATGIDFLKFTDAYVSVFFLDGPDCVVVTLDADADAPQVQEDRFYNAGGRLLGVDELELFDPKDSNLEIKNLKRDQDGIWRMARTPYRKKSDSKVSPVPLPTMLEVLGLKVVKVRDGKAGEDATDDFRYVVVPRVAAVSTTQNWGHGWVARRFFAPDPLNERIAIRERLKRLHRSFFNSKSPAPLPPTMAGGRELPLFSMIDMIRLFHKDEYDGFLSLTRSVSGALGPDAATESVLDRCRSTAADLPCFATDYDKSVAEVSALYDRWKEYSATRLADSLQRVDDVGFLTVIEWEMARRER